MLLHFDCYHNGAMFWDQDFPWACPHPGDETRKACTSTFTKKEGLQQHAEHSHTTAWWEAIHHQIHPTRPQVLAQIEKKLDQFLKWKDEAANADDWAAIQGHYAKLAKKRKKNKTPTTPAVVEDDDDSADE